MITCRPERMMDHVHPCPCCGKTGGDSDGSYGLARDGWQFYCHRWLATPRPEATS